MSLRLPGPAGELEAILELPVGEASACAVICHPHPQHGGTMHNKVVHTLARALLEQGHATLRFNYRGVGASQGQYDDGVGETDDARAVVSWMRQRFAGLPLTLAGFSFGGVVALRATGDLQPARLITIAPAVDRLAAEDIPRPVCPWLLVQGEADEVVDPGCVRQWAVRFVPPPQLVLMPGVGHFFHGALNQLRDIVQASGAA